MKLNKIKLNDKCVFFMNQILDNLVASKEIGWITVFISPENVVNESIDFKFNNIHIALNYFLSKIMK